MGQQAPAEMERQGPKSVHLGRLSLIALFIVTSLTGFLTLMYAMIIATAVPSLTEYFNTIQDLDWYSTAYLFAIAAIQPLTGKFYSLFSLKIVFLINIAIFEVGNIVCATATTSSIFIGGRAVAGVGAAGLFTGSMIIFTAAASQKVRNIVMALGMAITTVGGAVGPTIGGALTQNLGWRWCLWIFVPIHGVAAVILLLLRIPEQMPKAKAMTIVWELPQKLDLIGFALFSSAFTMLMLGMSWGGSQDPWGSPKIVGLLCGGGATAFVFSMWIWHKREKGLIPLPLLSKRVVLCASIASFFQVGTFSTIAYYLPLWFQSVKQASPLDSGIMILPTMVSQIVVTVVVTTLMAKIPRVNSVAPWATMGNICSAIGAGLLTSLSASTPVPTWAGFQILIGIGRGLAIQMPLVSLRNSLEPREIAIAVSLTVFFQYFGSTVFLAIAKSTFINQLGPALSQFAPDVDPASILYTGATEVLASVPPAEAAGVSMAYSKALATIFWVAVAGSIAAVFAASGLGWKPRVLEDGNQASAHEQK